MKIAIESILTETELSSISFGELDLVADTVDSLFESLRSYQKENDVKISHISIETKYHGFGMSITIKGTGEGKELEQQL